MDQMEPLNLSKLPLNLSKFPSHTLDKNCEHCRDSYRVMNISQIFEPPNQMEYIESSADLNCNICYNQFVDKKKLEYYAKKRQQRNQYTCKVCRKVYSSNHSLQVHQTWHENPNNQCRFCEKAYSSKYGVNYHIRTKHVSLAPWLCRFCHESFGTAVKLRRHIYEAHDSRKPFQCTHCEQTFLTLNNLNSHEIKHYQYSSFQCDKCKREFKYKRYLYAHIQRHTKCDQNGNRAYFDCSESLSTQRKVYQQNQFCCEFCKRGFSYKRSALNCSCKRKLKNKANNSKTDTTSDMNRIKVQISVLSEKEQQHECIPLYELDLPVNETPTIENNNNSISINNNNDNNNDDDDDNVIIVVDSDSDEEYNTEPVVLVQTYTTARTAETASIDFDNKPMDNPIDLSTRISNSFQLHHYSIPSETNDKSNAVSVIDYSRTRKVRSDNNNNNCNKSASELERILLSQSFYHNL